MGAVMDALQPFMWQNGKAVSPEEVARLRKIAEAAQGGATPTSFGGGLNALGADIGGIVAGRRATAGEDAGKAQAQRIYEALLGGKATPEAALGDSWLAADPGMSAVAQARAEQSMKQADPSYQLDNQYRQAQIDALNNKPAFDVPNGFMADPNNPNGVLPIENGPADGGDDAQAIADAIARGEQPPVTTGLYKLAGPVRAALAEQGFDMTKASQDYTATQRLLSTLNGPQQVRLRQAVAFTKDSLPIIEQLADEWKAGGFPALNKLQLEAAKQGLLGQKAASIATRLEAQINDMSSELGTVYKGGNSSTDESLRLAASNLNANWSEQTLRDAIGQIRQNLTYRENSMNLVTTAGFGDQSTYNPMTPAAPTASPALPEPDANGVITMPNGNTIEKYNGP